MVQIKCRKGRRMGRELFWVGRKDGEYKGQGHPNQPRIWGDKEVAGEPRVWEPGHSAGDFSRKHNYLEVLFLLHHLFLVLSSYNVVLLENNRKAQMDASRPSRGGGSP